MRMALYGRTYGNILRTMTLLTKEENEAHEKQAAFIAALGAGFRPTRLVPIIPAIIRTRCWMVMEKDSMDSYDAQILITSLRH